MLTEEIRLTFTCAKSKTNKQKSKVLNILLLKAQIGKLLAFHTCPTSKRLSRERVRDERLHGTGLWKEQKKNMAGPWSVYDDPVHRVVC